MNCVRNPEKTGHLSERTFNRAICIFSSGHLSERTFTEFSTLSMGFIFIWSFLSSVYVLCTAHTHTMELLYPIQHGMNIHDAILERFEGNRHVLLLLKFRKYTRADT